MQLGESEETYHETRVIGGRSRARRAVSISVRRAINRIEADFNVDDSDFANAAQAPLPEERRLR